MMSGMVVSVETGAAVQERLGYRPGLDGLRGLAVLLVVGVHVHNLTGGWRVEGGFLGVDVFFVLSGFLITTLLLERRDGLIDFYRRRARRLMPAVGLLLTVAAVVGAGWFVVGTSALYVANWSQLTPAFDVVWLDHLWSLAIEEQFYLAWPLAVLTLTDRRRAGRIVLVAVGGVALWRVGLLSAGASVDRLYRGTDTHSDGLLLGAALALLWPWATKFKAMALRFAPAALVTLGCLVAVLELGTEAMVTWGLPAVNLCAVVLVAAAVQGWGRWGPLVPVGRWSYSLYLWHFPVFVAASHLGGPLRWSVAVGGTIATTTMSYAVERRFRQVTASRRATGSSRRRSLSPCSG